MRAPDKMKSKQLPKGTDTLSFQQKARRDHSAKLLVTQTNNYVFASALIDAIHDPIIILTNDLTIQAANSAFFNVLKLTREESMQHNLREFVKRNPKVQRLITRLEKLIKTQKPFKQLELTYNFLTIGERIIHINAKRIIIDNQQTDFILLSITDVTQQKHIEQQKDDFVGYVTHELKTPLTSLSAFIQIMQGYHKNTKDKKAQFLLAKIGGQVERLTSLLSSFTTVYKAQNGMLVLNKTTCNLEDLIHEAVETFQYTTTTHAITIEGSLNKEITADRDRLRQVISNLLMNAIKYSPDADTIVVKLMETPKDVTVSVQDFGIGIPKNQQDRIFERFFRVKAKERDTIKGLGLGLYITSEIVKAHSGKIWVDSTEGQGSTFSFSLPIK